MRVSRNNKNIMFTKKDYFAIAFAVCNCLLMLKNIIITGSAVLYRNNSLLNIMLLCLCLCIYAFAYLKSGYVKVKKYPLFGVALILVFWIITYIFVPNMFTYSYVVEELTSFLIYSLPAFFILPKIEDYEQLQNEFLKLKIVFLITVIIAVILILKNGVIQGAGSRYAVYSMSFGRALIFPTLLYFSEWFNKNKKMDLVIGIFLTGVILTFGSRFPLVCIAFYIICKIMLNFKDNPVRSFGYISLIVSGVIFLIFGREYLVQFFNYVFEQFGIRSRGLAKLLSGDFAGDSGRSLIFREIIIKVNQSPVFGYGAAGANVALNNGLTHSLVLDIVGNLGYVGGFIFMLFVIVKVIKLWCESKCDYNKREFILLSLSMFLPISMIQSSLWRANYMWYLIVMPIKSKKKM